MLQNAEFHSLINFISLIKQHLILLQMNSPRCKMMMKLFLFYIVVLNMVITTAAVTTNNRILLSNVLVGTALAASVCKYMYIADDVRFLYLFLSFSLPSVRRISQWNLFVICFFFGKSVLNIYYSSIRSLYHISQSYSAGQYVLLTLS